MATDIAQLCPSITNHPNPQRAGKKLRDELSPLYVSKAWRAMGRLRHRQTSFHSFQRTLTAHLLPNNQSPDQRLPCIPPVLEHTIFSSWALWTNSNIQEARLSKMVRKPTEQSEKVFHEIGLWTTWKNNEVYVSRFNDSKHTQDSS